MGTYTRTRRIVEARIKSSRSQALDCCSPSTCARGRCKGPGSLLFTLNHSAGSGFCRSHSTWLRLHALRLNVTCECSSLPVATPLGLRLLAPHRQRFRDIPSWSNSFSRHLSCVYFDKVMLSRARRTTQYHHTDVKARKCCIKNAILQKSLFAVAFLE